MQLLTVAHEVAQTSDAHAASALRLLGLGLLAWAVLSVLAVTALGLWVAAARSRRGRR